MAGSLWVTMLAVSLVGVLIAILSPPRFHTAAFRPSSLGGRLIASFIGLSGFACVIWQVAVWYNASNGINGIHGLSPIALWAAISGTFVWSRVAYSWWLRGDSSEKQFSLRSVFLFVTAVAVVLSLVRWLHGIGVFICWLSLSVFLVCIGVRRKRLDWIFFGGTFIVVLVLGTPSLLTTARWVGHRPVSVIVRVQDLSGSPISNATVGLAANSGTSMASTDASGRANVVGDFQTCGEDAPLSNTGVIELLGEQLTVKAAGFKSFHRELKEIVDKGCWDLYAQTPPEVLIDLERDEKVPAGQK